MEPTSFNLREIERLQAMHTTPPQRQPLTDEAIQKLRHLIDWTSGWSFIDFARAIERAHGIGGDHD
jgi:hypothetical protein